MKTDPFSRLETTSLHITQEEIQEINIHKALSGISSMLPGTNLFSKSGLHFLTKRILHTIDIRNVNACWIDFTSYATTLSYGNNFGFESVFLNESRLGKTFVDNIDTYLSPCILQFNRNNKNIYFHKEFLNGNNIGYSSFIKSNEFRPDAEDYIFDQEIINKNANYANFKEVEMNTVFPGTQIFTGKELHKTYYSLFKIQQDFKEIQEKILNTTSTISDCLDYMHRWYRYYILGLDKAHKDKVQELPSVFMAVPCIAPTHNIDDEIGWGNQTAGFIFLVCKDDVTLEILRKKIGTICLSIYNDLSLITRNLPFAIALDLKARTYRESTKAAKAAIMSRNMSHNLGSHVMAYLKQSLNSVEDIIKSDALAELVTKNPSSAQIEKLNEVIANITKNKNEIELPFLVGVGKFIRYLQERQDFIATIATSYIPHLISVNFKDFIYDELNPDYRYERHIAERSGGRPHNVLLDNIAKSEGLNRNKINIKFRNWNGKETYHEDLQQMRDINVSLPGGVVGRQAIFSIFENIIRNAAKHGKWTDALAKRLELTIDVFDLMDEKLKIKLKRNDRKYYEYLKKNNYMTGKCNEDLLILSLTDNMTIDKKAFKKLEKAITEPYLDSLGSMINANKGIKEMRISAAWVRGVDDFYVEKDLPVVLSIYRSGENLRYIFCLKKPQKVAVITSKSLFALNPEMFIKKGWRFYTLNEYTKLTNRNFDLTLVESNIQSEIFNISPNRLVGESLEYITSHVKENKIEWLELELWKKFLGDRLSTNTVIHIEDEKLYYSKSKNKENKEPLKLCNGKVIVYPNVLGASKNSPEYLYRTHHGGETQLHNFLKNSLISGLYKDNLFVEGISGHNSTDRIIRNDTINDIWFYKQINTVTTKIAIFDERLFQKLSGTDEGNIKDNQIGTSLATANLYKGIFVFNLISSRKNQFHLYGFRLPDKHEIKKNGSSSIIIRVGTVLIKNRSITIKPLEEFKKVGSAFTYLSIHQGLLDKIYSMIPDIESDEKIQVTEMLCKPFLNEGGRSKLIIHSGRSKPSNEDMPQRVPFAQFAAVENAFDDSKHALVELLDFAQYENNNND